MHTNVGKTDFTQFLFWALILLTGFYYMQSQYPTVYVCEIVQHIWSGYKSESFKIKKLGENNFKIYRYTHIILE